MSLDNYDYSVTKHGDGKGFTINAREKNDEFAWVGIIIAVVIGLGLLKGCVFGNDDTVTTKPVTAITETAKNNLEVAAWCAAANAVASDVYDAQGEILASAHAQQEILAIQAPWAQDPAYRQAAISAVDYMQQQKMSLEQLTDITSASACKAK